MSMTNMTANWLTRATRALAEREQTDAEGAREIEADRREAVARAAARIGFTDDEIADERWKEEDLELWIEGKALCGQWACARCGWKTKVTLFDMATVASLLQAKRRHDCSAVLDTPPQPTIEERLIAALRDFIQSEVDCGG